MPKVVYLLLLEERAEDRECYIRLLKNQGIATRDKAIGDLEQLEEALAERAWDMLICSQLPEPGATEHLLAQFHRQDNPTASLVITPDHDLKNAQQLLESGASQVIAREQSELLEIFIPRELQRIETQQQLTQYMAQTIESEHRCRTLMDSSRDAIAYIQDGMHVYTNLSYRKLFGVDDQDYYAATPLLDLIDKTQRGTLKQLLRTLPNQERQSEQLACRCIKENGQPFKAKMQLIPAELDGESCLQITLQDLSQEEALSKKIRTISRLDLLTGLYNRPHFIQRLQQMLSRDTPPNHYLAFIRLDNHSQLQQRLGTAAADIVVRDVAHLIKPLLGKQVELARFADSAFTALLAKDGDKDIRPLFDDICQKIKQQSFEIDGKSVTTSCSVGLATITKSDQTPQKLLTEAERATNLAQHGGGNIVHQLHAMETSPANSPENNEKIKQALRENRFRLVFQPIVSLHAEPGERYEVLIRMLAEDQQEIAPADFLPLAEAACLMNEIDRWVLKHSITALAQHRSAGKKLKLFLKLSADSIRDPSLLTWINTYLTAAKVPGDCLVFEAAEEVMLSLPDESERLIRDLKQIHCQFSIDHVTGMLDSLDYLTHLNVDYLKIDGSLVNSLSGDTTAQATTQKIASAAQANDKLTIAEFVHDANTLALLWQYGVNFVQGFYLQKPDTNMDYNFDSQ